MSPRRAVPRTWDAPRLPLRQRRALAEALRKAARANDVATIDQHLSQDWLFGRRAALQTAAFNGHQAAVERLTSPKAGPTNHAGLLSALRGHCLSCVRWLWPRTRQTKAERAQALRTALQAGDADAVALIAPGTDLTDGLALTYAVRQRRWDLVGMLMAHAQAPTRPADRARWQRCVCRHGATALRTEHWAVADRFLTFMGPHLPPRIAGLIEAKRARIPTEWLEAWVDQHGHSLPKSTAWLIEQAREARSFLIGADA